MPGKGHFKPYCLRGHNRREVGVCPSGTCKACKHVYYALLNQKSHALLKQEVVFAYGGTCVCCGEEHQEFLSIDHVNGGGTQFRKSAGASSLYPLLRKEGFPKVGYRLLCFNCNWSVGRYGYCPHQSSGEVPHPCH